jgi:hypothetical protein
MKKKKVHTLIVTFFTGNVLCPINIVSIHVLRPKTRNVEATLWDRIVLVMTKQGGKALNIFEKSAQIKLT